MADNISMYVSDMTRDEIEKIAQERYGTTTQKSVVVAEAIRTDMYYADNEVDETPIVSKAQQVPVEYFGSDKMPTQIGVEHSTVDASDKSTIRVSLPSRFIDYLDTHGSGRGRTLDDCMRLYTKLLYVDVDEIQDDDDEDEDEQQFSDVNEYLLKTDKSELSASGIDAHEVKESSKYRIPYILAKLNDEYRHDMDIERSDVDDLVRDTFTVSEPTVKAYRNKVYNSLESPLPDVDDNIFNTKVFDSYNRKAPASTGLTKQRAVIVFNFADELLLNNYDNFDELIEVYTNNSEIVDKNKKEIADDIIDLLQLYKSDNCLQIDAINDRIDTVISDLESL